MTCMRKLLPQRDLVGKRALLEDRAFLLPWGAVESSVFQWRAQHPRGGKEKVVKDFFSIPKGQYFINYFARRSRGTWDLVAMWREGLVVCRMQQQREGKEVPCLQKDHFTTSSKEAFTISPSLHNLGRISVFFHCVQHLLFPR